MTDACSKFLAVDVKSTANTCVLTSWPFKRAVSLYGNVWYPHKLKFQCTKMLTILANSACFPEVSASASKLAVSQVSFDETGRTDWQNSECEAGYIR